MAPPSPFSPLASFGSVVAGRSRSCQPFHFLPGDRLLVFGGCIALCFRSCHRWWVFGEGLGGDTPPNERACERSELLYCTAAELSTASKLSTGAAFSAI